MTYGAQNIYYSFYLRLKTFEYYGYTKGERDSLVFLGIDNDEFSDLLFSGYVRRFYKDFTIEILPLIKLYHHKNKHEFTFEEIQNLKYQIGYLSKSRNLFNLNMYSSTIRKWIKQKTFCFDFKWTFEIEQEKKELITLSLEENGVFC